MPAVPDDDPFGVTTGGRLPPVEDVAADFILKREEGLNPSLDEYLARYPKYAEELARILAWDTVPPPTRKEPDATPIRTARITATEVAPTGAPDEVRLGPYTGLEHVSTAGGGTVYRARHAGSGQIVALKVMDARGAGDARDVERFKREADMLRKLDLVNVVPVLDSGEERGRFWIAMKWVEGETVAKLRETVKQSDHRLHGMQERARFVARIARTFAAIHGFGILHRDVKPSNLLVDRTGEPMIIDFGIAQAPNLPELTVTDDQVMGTPRYLAPELIEGGNSVVSNRTDIYGLGLSLYELCVGTEAFSQRTRGELFDHIRSLGPTPPRKVESRVPPDLEAVILRSIEIDPLRRYADMAAFAGDLERVARGESPDRITLKRARPLSRLLHRHKRGLLVAAALFVAILAVAAWIGTTQIRPELRARAIEAELRPFAWFPPEAFADGIGLPPRALTLELGSDDLAPAATLERRRLAAWVNYLAGRPGDARASLGEVGSGDGFAALVLRDVWTRGKRGAGVTHADAEMAFPDNESRQALVPTDETREQPLAPQEVDAILMKPGGLEPRVVAGDSRDHIVAAVMLWGCVSNDPAEFQSENQMRRRTAVREHLRACLSGETEAPARFIQAELSFIDRQWEAARSDLEFVVTAQPRAVGARYLLGVVEQKAGHIDRARTLLDGVARELPKSHPASRCLTGRLALIRAAGGQVDDALGLLKAWWSREDATWHDEIMPRVLAAQILRRAARLDEAKARLLEAVRRDQDLRREEKERAEQDDPNPGSGPPIVLWKPAIDELLEVLDATGEHARAEEIRAKLAKVGTMPVPKSAETFLDLNAGGLRPLSPVRNFILGASPGMKDG